MQSNVIFSSKSNRYITKVKRQAFLGGRPNFEAKPKLGIINSSQLCPAKISNDYPPFPPQFAQARMGGLCTARHANVSVCMRLAASVNLLSFETFLHL